MRTMSIASFLLILAAMRVNAEIPTAARPVTKIDPDAAFIMGKDALVTPHIVGGQPAGPGQFPWAVATITRQIELCGASLIAPRWTLSVSKQALDKHSKCAQSSSRMDVIDDRTSTLSLNLRLRTASKLHSMVSMQLAPTP